MNQSFDQEIRNALREEQISVPEHTHQRTEALLNALPEKTISSTRSRVFFRPIRKLAAIAACVLFVMLVLLPNVSVTYAHAMENIPVIGELVEIFTIRNYFTRMAGMNWMPISLKSKILIMSKSVTLSIKM